MASIFSSGILISMDWELIKNPRNSVVCVGDKAASRNSLLSQDLPEPILLVVRTGRLPPSNSPYLDCRINLHSS